MAGAHRQPEDDAPREVAHVQAGDHLLEAVRPRVGRLRIQVLIHLRVWAQAHSSEPKQAELSEGLRPLRPNQTEAEHACLGGSHKFVMLLHAGMLQADRARVCVHHNMWSAAGHREKGVGKTPG